MAFKSYYANGSLAGYGLEGTYGTPAARTVFRDIISSTLAPVTDREDRQYTRSGATSFVPMDNYVTRKRWEGTTVHELAYDNFGFLLKHWLGTGSTTGPVGAVYQHTHTIALALPVGFSVLMNRGLSVKDIYGGGKIFKGRVIQQLRKPALLSLDMKGTVFSRADTIEAATLATNETCLQAHHCGAFSWNGISIDWMGWTLEMDNGLVEREFGGSLYMQEPKRDKPQIITLEAEVDADDALLAAYDAGTRADLTITYNDPDSLKLLVITVHNAQILSYDDSLGSQLGVFKAKVKWHGYADAGLAGADQGLKFVVDNLTTTAVGNG